MRRAVLTAGLGLTISGLMVIPAGALAQQRPDAPTPIVVDDGSKPIPTDPVPVKPVPTDPVPIDPVPIDPRPVDPQPEREHLRLSCSGRLSADESPLIGCEWSPTHRRDAAGYVVTRTNGDVREVILTTRDLSKTSVVDSAIRFDVRYRYVVQVLNAEGRTIGSSGVAHAGVVSPDTDLEVLNLHCRQGAAGGVHDGRRGRQVGCEWRAAEHPDAVAYQLWRIVDRDERELVWRGGLDTTAARDHVGSDASRVLYVVLGLDAEGGIVGRSRPSEVWLRPVVPTRAVANRFI